MDTMMVTSDHSSFFKRKKRGILVGRTLILCSDVPLLTTAKDENNDGEKLYTVPG